MIAISYKLMTFNEPATLLKKLKIELKPSDIFTVKKDEGDDVRTRIS